MAIVGDFRYRIPGGPTREPTISSNGTVNFDVRVEQLLSDTPVEDWSEIRMGHFTVSIDAAILEACANAAEAKQLIHDIILARGLAQATRARQAMIALLPGGTWPISDITMDLVL